MDWRTLATSYGFVDPAGHSPHQHRFDLPESCSCPDLLTSQNLIPLPKPAAQGVEGEAAESFAACEVASSRSVCQTPKLTVPRDIQRAETAAAEMAPPKIVVNNFTPTVLKVSGGARPALIVHTGEFGSSAAPTLNAPVQKVQTGGFGDPNGIPGEAKKAQAHDGENRIVRPAQGPGTRQRLRRRKWPERHGRQRRIWQWHRPTVGKAMGVATARGSVQTGRLRQLRRWPSGTGVKPHHSTAGRRATPRRNHLSSQIRFTPRRRGN